MQNKINVYNVKVLKNKTISNLIFGLYLTNNKINHLSYVLLDIKT